MFFIPSKQIPPVFDSKVVSEDFELICQLASSRLKISAEELSETLRQVAEDELNRRLEDVIENHSQPKKRRKEPVRCAEPGCIVKKITKPQVIEDKTYCTFHYRQKKTSKEDLHVSMQKLELSDPQRSDLEPIEYNVWSNPRSIHLIENESFWTFSRIKHPDDQKEYRYHKVTGLVVQIHGRNEKLEVELIGRYFNDQFTDKSLLSQDILDWCIDSQLTI